MERESGVVLPALLELVESSDLSMMQLTSAAKYPAINSTGAVHMSVHAI
jgi:hypothetical protein